MKQEINTNKSYPAIGPYSQAIRVGNLIFCSGVIAIDSQTNKFVKGGIRQQTKQIFENIKNILQQEGVNIDSIVKTTVYLKDMNDFSAMNEVYATYFQRPYPARATVEVSRLPKDALIEIEWIAYIDNDDCCGRE